jgi:hypothetical protein
MLYCVLTELRKYVVQLNRCSKVHKNSNGVALRSLLIVIQGAAHDESVCTHLSACCVCMHLKNPLEKVKQCSPLLVQSVCAEA